MSNVGVMPDTGGERRFEAGTVIQQLRLVSADSTIIEGIIDFRMDGERYKFKVHVDSQLLEGPDRKANLLGGSRRKNRKANKTRRFGKKKRNTL